MLPLTAVYLPVEKEKMLSVDDHLHPPQAINHGRKTIQIAPLMGTLFSTFQ